MNTHSKVGTYLEVNSRFKWVKKKENITKNMTSFLARIRQNAKFRRFYIE